MANLTVRERERCTSHPSHLLFYYFIYILLKKRIIHYNVFARIKLILNILSTCINQYQFNYNSKIFLM